MAYNRSHAQRLCTADELDVFQASLSDAIGALDANALKDLIRRTRRLRQKSTDLFLRQTASIREATGTKRGKTGLANARTEQKAKLFAETLARFEKRLAQLEAAEERKTGRAKLLAMMKGGADAAAARRPDAGHAPEAPLPRAQKRAATKNPHATTKRAHTASAGKRAQAKRDKR